MKLQVPWPGMTVRFCLVQPHFDPSPKQEGGKWCPENRGNGAWLYPNTGTWIVLFYTGHGWALLVTHLIR